MTKRKWIQNARLVAVATIFAWVIAPSTVLAACVLPLPTEDLGVLQLADRAANCLREKDAGRAGKIFYAQVIRARTLSAVDQDPKGWSASAESIQAQLGGPVNRWLGGDVDEWMAAIHWALVWDSRAPWREGREVGRGLGVSEAGMLASRASSRRALERLNQDLLKMNRDKFKKSRQASGLGYRGTAVK